MCGFISVNKPSGITSAQATHTVRKAFKSKASAGHTGTLDPLASGVLVIALGSSTRFIQFLAAAKQYLVDCQFGMVTTTGDLEGEVESTHDIPDDYAARASGAFAELTGKIQQRAPAYSALKYKGKALYHYARAGIKVPDKIRTVEITSIDIIGDDQQGKLKLKVQCGSGTYIRSLVVDLGSAIGCGATMVGLVRSKCCGLCLADCVSIDVERDAILAAIIQPEELLQQYSQVQLIKPEDDMMGHGQAIPYTKQDGLMRLYNRSGEFFGMGRGDGSQLSAVRLLPNSGSASRY